MDGHRRVEVALGHRVDRAPELGPGAVQDDRPQPADLAPDPVLVLTDAPKRSGTMRVLLAFLARRLFFAAVALVAVAAIDYAMPWILVAAPFGAVVMRFAQAAILEEIDSDYVRTAAAKGLPRREVIRRHAARPGYVSVASLVGVWVPTFVINMVSGRVRVLHPRLLRPVEARIRPGGVSAGTP